MLVVVLSLAEPHGCCRYMAVAKPGIETLTPEDVSVFKVPFGAFIKMHAGTWHAGPHFEEIEHMDFYNLELCDTNQVQPSSECTDSHQAVGGDVCWCMKF